MVYKIRYKKCGECGEQFSYRKQYATYCSRHCFGMSKRFDKSIRTCGYCKKEYMPEKTCRKVKYCSRECSNEGKKGFKHTDEYKIKASEIKLDDKNPMWKGNDVGYHATHNWVRRRKKKPEFCEECNEAKPIDLANISQQYKRSIDDFEWLCRKCHMVKDGRLKNLQDNNRRSMQNGEL